MTGKTFISDIQFTFKESNFKSATKFNLRIKHLIEKALGEFVEVECKGLKEGDYDD